MSQSIPAYKFTIDPPPFPNQQKKKQKKPRLRLRLHSLPSLQASTPPAKNQKKPSLKLRIHSLPSPKTKRNQVSSCVYILVFFFFFKLIGLAVPYLIHPKKRTQIKTASASFINQIQTLLRSFSLPLLTQVICYF